jgi:uncharacterized membrane protein required for colicin V production
MLNTVLGALLPMVVTFLLGFMAAWRHDAMVNLTELAMPPSVTVEMAKGFSLYMVKTIIGGRANKVIDLAKTNLWR